MGSCGAPSNVEKPHRCIDTCRRCQPVFPGPPASCASEALGARCARCNRCANRAMVRFARLVGQVGQKAQDAQGPSHVLILFPHESRIVKPFGGAPWKSPTGEPCGGALRGGPHGRARWASSMRSFMGEPYGRALWAFGATPYNHGITANYRQSKGNIKGKSIGNCVFTISKLFSHR